MFGRWSGIGGFGMSEVALRPVEDAGLDALFEQMRDPESVRMAAFTAADPDDRAAFDAHMARVRTSPGVTHRAVGRLSRDAAPATGSDQHFPHDGSGRPPRRAGAAGRRRTRSSP
ncbi:hypothetical protein Axi01nite_35830 [Actinoplanes xinjiangensis]|nr:hypothetical protein Axi01nite_35830 [Actinoplanes xinjiangensis]